MGPISKYNAPASALGSKMKKLNKKLEQLAAEEISYQKLK